MNYRKYNVMLKTPLLNLFLVATIAIVGGAARGAESVPLIRVMSFNIRYGTANDGVNRWDARKDFLVETIEDFDPDLLGTQETLASQRDYLAERMPDFDFVAAGRDDGNEKGEMAALYFRKERFEKLNSGHFWLSETPEKVGSKGWDAALPRIATWVKLKDLRMPESEPILFLNTHFDHQGERARAESAQLIRRKLVQMGEGYRCIVTGDFNADPAQPPYRELFELDTNGTGGQSSLLVDTLRVYTPTKQLEEGTFSGFDATKTGGSRIDWIACSREFEVRLAGIDRTSLEGRTPSDHFPVTAVLRPRVPSVQGALRVLTYNIHHAIGVDGALDIPRIGEVIRSADADVVALQEVDQGTKRTFEQKQLEMLARYTGLYGRFAKAIDFQGGEYGQAILSREPIAEFTIHQLPNESGREQRIAVDATVNFQGKTIRIVSTHLDHSSEELRQRQADRLVALFENVDGLVILAGDLNATPESKTMKRIGQVWNLEASGSTGATYPAETPSSQIDYILTKRKAPVSLVEIRVIDEPIASDHRPVLGIFR
ncbi:MAG: hypothetical protein FJ308_03195 [Planctomycetes bacterium]|nr:hypothetical protein [Planctomycetota bacterium]